MKNTCYTLSEQYQISKWKIVERIEIDIANKQSTWLFTFSSINIRSTDNTYNISHTYVDIWYLICNDQNTCLALLMTVVYTRTLFILRFIVSFFLYILSSEFIRSSLSFYSMVFTDLSAISRKDCSCSMFQTVLVNHLQIR
jgi:hypothetical protein